MRTIGRIFRLFGAGLMLVSIAGAIAAHRAKSRLPKLEEPEADEVHVSAIFEPTAFRSTSKSFRGGTLDCWYGGGVVDLREAILDPAGAVLKVRALFGGARVLVPASWLVTTNVRGLGGIADGRPFIERLLDAPHLTVEGFAVFGGFAIASEITDAETKSVAEAVAKSPKRRVAVSVEPAAA